MELIVVFQVHRRRGRSAVRKAVERDEVPRARRIAQVRTVRQLRPVRQVPRGVVVRDSKRGREKPPVGLKAEGGEDREVGVGHFFFRRLWKKGLREELSR